MADFTITENSDGDGELTFNSSPDFEDPKGSPDMGTDADNTYEVTVEIKDSKADDGTADTVVDDDLDVVITVTNVNEAPMITTPETTKNVAENSTAVLTFAATDVDASDRKTWSVDSGDDGSFFDISTSGALSFNNPPDFEDKKDGNTDNVYEVTVKVTDSGRPERHSRT